ncbi:hypothetical protein BH11BAC2_BH11BAC2_22340 [soil metagenome]
MQKPLFIIILLAAVTAGTAFSILSETGKAGYTGSTGETTCISCHNTYPVSNGGPGYLTITSNLVNGTQYIPGQTYTMHVKV